VSIVKLLNRPTQTETATATIASFELRPPRANRRRLYTVVALVLAIALVLSAVFVVRARSSAAVSYVTQPLVREDLAQTVTATGTVNPQNTVAVGTQVSGTLSEVDVDYNSKVKKGQILAKIDPTTFQAALDQAEAGLEQAQAQADSAEATATGAYSGIGSASASARVAVADAASSAQTAQANEAAVAAARTNVTKDQSALALAQQTVNRDASLLAQGFIAQSQADTDRSALVAAQSTLDAANAAVQQAQLTANASASQAQAAQSTIAAQNFGVSSAQASQLTQADTARAQVQTAELNLQRTVITSPVDGTVIARDVSVGTTVAASLSTPTLFSIAQNLQKMEVDLSVGEPDIGNVRTGDSVSFTVLAYPARTFTGIVSQVRINPTTTSNVVTYTTVVTVANKHGALLPGMTANAAIAVAKAPNALVVPLTALQYRPAASGNSGAHRRTNAEGAASPWGAAASGAATAAATAGSAGHVFALRDGKLVRIPVTIGLTTSTNAAVTPLAPATLAAGDAIVTSDTSAHAATASTHTTAASTRNPLAGVGGGGGGFGGGSR
jgi:HlyD family secretion protein